MQLVFQAISAEEQKLKAMFVNRFSKEEHLDTLVDWIKEARRLAEAEAEFKREEEAQRAAEAAKLLEEA
ncbi:hypothetical protein AK812_SmicGene23905 [Symbiodinium microadriaticum]|uniref:Uncharacterized protein n=1 Tax=Symbiodinium microadriaticum TaxID=2951 RepID=A0A1Q9DG00_SYMMI|nr:hypothetical protein AK812_SmicGene23905 [Symbiodinium microadriaticum]